MGRASGSMPSEQSANALASSVVTKGDVGAYLDRKIAFATRPYQGLGRTRLAWVQAHLRHELETDPHLRELVRIATT